MTKKQNGPRGAAVVEYALFMMAMVVGTAAASKLVGEHGRSVSEIASSIVAPGSTVGGNDELDGDRGHHGGARDEGDDGAGGSGGGASHSHHGNPPRAKVTRKDDALSPP